MDFNVVTCYTGWRCWEKFVLENIFVVAHPTHTQTYILGVQKSSEL